MKAHHERTDRLEALKARGDAAIRDLRDITDSMTSHAGALQRERRIPLPLRFVRTK